MSNVKPARELWRIDWFSIGPNAEHFTDENEAILRAGAMAEWFPVHTTHYIEYSALTEEREHAKRLVEALEYIVNRENLAFAECYEAEEIWSRAKNALAAYEKDSTHD